MINFYHTCQFSTLTINFSEVWPRQSLDFGKQFNLMIRFENVFKTSWQDVLKTSSKRLEDVLKTFLQDVLKMSSRRFCKMLENVLKTSWKRFEDVWPRRICWSWSRRLEEVRRIYSSWSRRLEDVFSRRRWKTSSRRFHQDDYLLGNFLKDVKNCDFGLRIDDPKNNYDFLTKTFINIVKKHALLKKKFIRGKSSSFYESKP